MSFLTLPSSLPHRRLVRHITTLSPHIRRQPDIITADIRWLMVATAAFASLLYFQRYAATFIFDVIIRRYTFFIFHAYFAFSPPLAFDVLFDNFAWCYASLFRYYADALSLPTAHARYMSMLPHDAEPLRRLFFTCRHFIISPTSVCSRWYAWYAIIFTHTHHCHTLISSPRRRVTPCPHHLPMPPFRFAVIFILHTPPSRLHYITPFIFSLLSLYAITISLITCHWLRLRQFSPPYFRQHSISCYMLVEFKAPCDIIAIISPLLMLIPYLRHYW